MQSLALLALLGAATAQQTKWGQCGGINWTGPTTCVSGTTCVYQNDYYSQCLPGSSPTTTAQTTMTPMTTMTTMTSMTSATSTSSNGGPQPTSSSGSLKPRIVVLSDITPANWEPDDLQSFIHLLASADLFEIEGIISTTGFSIGDNTPLKTYIFNEVIAEYEKDLPNLMKRSGQAGFMSDEGRQQIGYWPSPAYLRGVVKEGIAGRGMDNVGDGKDTPGTNHIIDVVDRSDERPVWILLWGGGNTLAQAIWDVRRTRSASQLNTFLSKMRVYAITDQDRNYQNEGLGNSAQSWMRKTFQSNFFYIWSYSSWGTYGSTIKSQYWSRYQSEIKGKGNLGRKYPDWKYIVEGDSPSFLHCWPGLNDPNDPTQYGFGGRFVRGTGEDNTPAWLDRSGDARTRSNTAVTSTLGDQVNDFVARMDWAARGSGNRNPKLLVNGDNGYMPVVIPATVGSTATLDATGSTDPDGNSISYSWKHDNGAGYSGSVFISAASSQKATVQIPSGASGQDIHVVLRAVDNGSPALASYRRAILRVN